MFINKNKKGFGWHLVIDTKELGLNEPLYVNFSFKKGCEPADINSIKGDLYFVSEEGTRKVFPVAKEYNGKVYVDYKLLELEEAKKPVKSYKRSEVETSIDDGGFTDEDYPW